MTQLILNRHVVVGIASQAKKALKSSAILTNRYQLISTGVYTSQNNCGEKSTTAQEWAKAQPLSECPTLKPLEALRGILPFGKFYKKDVNGFVRTLHAEKGPIVYMAGGFGKADIVMTSNPDDFETVFRREGIWPQRMGFEILSHYRNVYRKEYFGRKSGLVTTQNEDWSEIRTAVNPIIIHPKNVKRYLPALTQVNQDFIDKIKTIRNKNTLEVPGNFKDEISSWTLESIAVVALDQRLGLIAGSNPNGKRFFDGLKEFFELSVELEIKPSMWRLLPTKAYRRAMQIFDEMVALVESYVNEAMLRIEQASKQQQQQQQSADHELSVLEKLLKIDKKIATIMAMDMLFAGVDTTTTTFAGLLLCLAKNPAKQQKLREEILSILPRKDSQLTVENMKNMPYLRACIKESLRVYPLATGNVRTTVEDLVLSNYRVPKGTQVAMMNLMLLESEQYYERAGEFLPERWLRSQKGESSCPHESVGKTSHPFVYLPFGFGPRSCIGRRIAEMELEIGIARIVRNFQVEFNYSTENAFVGYQLNTPAIPLKFKFTDLQN